MQTTTANSSAWLDLIRGVAALLVFFSHWRNLFFVDYGSVDSFRQILLPAYVITSWGHSAVIVFFVLSGFLVGGSCLQRFRSSRFAWGAYAIERASRLYTVLIPALCLGATIDLIGSMQLGGTPLYAGLESRHVLSGAPIASISWPIFAGNAAFLQTIKVPTFGSNGPLWSLANEGWYYVLFPLCLLGLGRSRSIIGRFLLIAATVGILVFVGKQIAAYYSIWLIGAVVAMLPQRRVPHWAWVAVLALVTAVPISEKAIVHNFPSFEVSLISDAILALLFAAFLYCVIQPSAPVLPSGISRMGRALSRVSYSLYLSHLPLLVLMAAFLGGRVQPHGRGLSLPMACAALCLAYCTVIYLIFERRTQSVRRFLQDIAHHMVVGRQEPVLDNGAERRVGNP